MRTLGANDIIDGEESWGTRVRAGAFGNSGAPPPPNTIAGMNGTGRTYRIDCAVASLCEGAYALPASFGSAEGMNRPDTWDAGSWAGSIAAAKRFDNFDLVAAYAHRDQGNYYAGTHGPTPTVELTYRELPFYTEVTAIRDGIARFRGGERIVNSNNESSSLLLKSNIYLSDDQSWDLGYVRYDSKYGEMMPSQLIWLDQIKQTDNSSVTAQTYTSRYQWNPAAQNWLDLRFDLWHTHTDTVNRSFSEDIYETFSIPPAPEHYNRWGGTLGNQMHFDRWGSHKLEFGVTSQWEDINTQIPLGENGAPVDNTSYGRIGDRQEVGAFLNWQWKLRPTLTLEAGVRYTHARTDDHKLVVPRGHDEYLYDDNGNVVETVYVQSVFCIDRDGNGACDPIRYRTNNAGTAPVVSLTYEPWRNGLQFYARSAQAVRNPSLFETTSGWSVQPALDVPIQPEHAYNLEVGSNFLKRDALLEGDRLAAKFAVFRNHTRNYLTRTSPNAWEEQGQIFVMRNIDTVNLHGAELTLEYDPGHVYGELGGAYYDHIEVCSYGSYRRESCNDYGVANSYFNNMIPPKWHASATLGVRLFARRLDIGARGTFMGQRTETPPFNDDTARGFNRVVPWRSYNVFDLYASWKYSDAIAADFSIDNLTDRYYLDALSLGLVPAPRAHRTPELHPDFLMSLSAPGDACMTLVRRLLTLSFLSLLLSACGGGGSDDPPKPPIANAGADQTLEYGGTVTLDASGSSSPQVGATLSYTWTLLTKPAGSTASLSNTTATKPTFVADIPGAYEADLVVSDGTTSSTHDRVAVTATNPNPVAAATPQHNVLIGTTVALDGSASVPPTGVAASALSYHWTLTSKPARSLAAIAGALNSTASVFADVVGTYTATLVVTYQDKSTAPLLVTITATQSNTAPIASAGGPYTIERGKTLTLDGTGSSDADGNTLSYRWYLMSPGSAAGSAAIWSPNGSALRLENVIQGYNTAKPTITPDVAGSWSAYLVVYDGTTLSNLSTASITVTKPAGAANTPPVADFFGTPRVNFFTPAFTSEVELGTTVFSSGNSWDIDGTLISGTGKRRYQWISTPAGFTQNNLAGASSFSFTPTVAGDYTVEMTANDGEADSAPVRRTFTARTGANRAPVPGITVDSSTILVNDTGWFDARTSTDLDGDRLTYNWFLFDKPDGSTATLKFENVTREDGTVLANARAGVVADKPGIYMVLLSVTDSHGITSTPASVYYGRVIAKAQNNAPNIERISNNNDWSLIRRTNMHFNDTDQPYIVGGEPVTIFTFNAVDPDLDTLYYLWTLQQPAGSTLTDAGTQSTFMPGAPVVPGTYTVTAIVSDGIARSEPKTLRFSAVERANHPSLLLEDFYSAYPPNLWDRAITNGVLGVAGGPAFPGNMARPRAFPYWDHADGSFPVSVASLPTEAGDVIVKNYRLTAFGGDYTIANLKVGAPARTGANVFSGKFAGLASGQVVKKGESVNFSLVVTVPANAYDYVRAAGNIGPDPDVSNGGNGNFVTGMTFTFGIAEKSGWTFEYQPGFF
ncbi:MAG: TonB-dependent receptor [Gammaproteobacteria bacterium]